MAATLALRIGASFGDIRYINARRVFPSNGKMRLFYFWTFGIKGTPLTSIGRQSGQMEAASTYGKIRGLYKELGGPSA
jgi:hypothetical protein